MESSTRSAGARDSAATRRTTTRLVGWRLEGVPVLGPEGGCNAATSPDRSPHRGERGAHSACALLSWLARPVLVNTPTSSHTNFTYISLCVSVCVLAGALSGHTPTPGDGPTPRQEDTGEVSEPGRRSFASFLAYWGGPSG